MSMIIVHVCVSSSLLTKINFILVYAQVETYGTSTVVFIPYFAVIQTGELRPYTIGIRCEYAEKYGENTTVSHRPGLQRNTV